MELVEVGGGSFLMGSENGAEDERPVHEVSVGAFLIGKYPVTNREYLQYVESNGSAHRPVGLEDANFNDPLQPVTSLNWFDAESFCRWLSNTTGFSFRLPTEAEWEYAACAGNPNNIYPWGTRGWDECTELHSRFQNGPERAGCFDPNPWGLYDMGMNVHEWCSDWYDSGFYSHSTRKNPTGPESGSRRASRGGSWRHQVKITRCAARSSIPPSYRYADYGFRVVRS